MALFFVELGISKVNVTGVIFYNIFAFKPLLLS
jgi:hypothetical protein